MEAILAIMLYLSLIFSPGSYYQSEIDDLYMDNQVEINEVQNDAQLNPMVQSTYGPQVEYIVISEEPED